MQEQASTPAAVQIVGTRPADEEDVRAFVDIMEGGPGCWPFAAVGVIGIVGACWVIAATGWPYTEFALAMCTCLGPTFGLLALMAFTSSRRERQLGLAEGELKRLHAGYLEVAAALPRETSKRDRRPLLVARMRALQPRP